MSQWRRGQSHHTPLTPGRRRQQRNGFFYGVGMGAVFAFLIYALIALIVWGARELLG
jgi:hypothetical protein